MLGGLMDFVEITPLIDFKLIDHDAIRGRTIFPEPEYNQNLEIVHDFDDYDPAMVFEFSNDY
jgi:hypothetical protein